MGPVMSLADVHIRRHAGDQYVRLAFCIDEVAQMTRVHHIEHAVAHDDFFLARPSAQDPGKFLHGFDFPAILVRSRQRHTCFSDPR